MPAVSPPFITSAAAADVRYHWLQRCWMVSWLLLLVVTWRLWIPPQAFPAVPLIGPPLIGPWSVPEAVEWSLVLAMVAAVVSGVWVRTPRQRSIAMIGFLVSGIGMVLLNQHRLQPWFYQAILLAVVFASTEPRRGLSRMRWLAIGVYFYSSMGKFDFQFLHTVGQQFLHAACDFVGLNWTAWGERTQLWAAGLFPCVELAAAVGLVFRRTQMIAAGLAMVMHAITILLLSPLGLHHQPGVLVWNAAMVVQLGWLFLFPVVAAVAEDTAGDNTTAGDASAVSRQPTDYVLSPIIGTIVFYLAMAMPVLERQGYWDHWTSWALYSPHNSRVTLQVHASDSDRLDPLILGCMSPADEYGWRTMDLDRWSIDALGVPNYPQARFQLGVAIGLIQCNQLERNARIRMQGVSNRWTGQREQSTIVGRVQWDAASEQFWLNVHPRDCPQL